MNKSTALFATTTAILAVVSLYLARSLQVERGRLAAAVAAQAASPPSTAPTNAEPDPANAATVTAATTPSPPAKPAARDTGPSEVTQKITLPARVRNRTVTSAELAYRRLELQRQHPDLVAALNLQPDEADRFFDLLARQQVDDAEHEASNKGPGDVIQRERDRRQRAYGAEQVEFLGGARTADWSRYVDSLGTRAEVRELRTLLADSDYPLRRDQYEPLVATLAKEQARHKAERDQLHRSQPDTGNATPQEVIEYFGQRLDLIEASLERRRRAAETVLDGEQLRRYQTMLDLQRQRARADHDSWVMVNAEAAKKQAKVR